MAASVACCRVPPSTGISGPMWVHQAIPTAVAPEKVRLAPEYRTSLVRKSGGSLASDRTLGRRGAALSDYRGISNDRFIRTCHV